MPGKYSHFTKKPGKGDIDEFIKFSTKQKIYNRFTEEARKRLYALTFPNHLIRKLSQLLSAAKSRAKTKGIPFDLTLLQLMFIYMAQKGEDPFKGWELSFISGEGRGNANDYVISIDRVFPELGYTVSNVILDCWATNRMRGRQGIERFDRDRQAIAANAHITSVEVMQNIRREVALLTG